LIFLFTQKLDSRLKSSWSMASP